MLGLDRPIYHATWEEVHDPYFMREMAMRGYIVIRPRTWFDDWCDEALPKITRMGLAYVTGGRSEVAINIYNELKPSSQQKGEKHER